MRSFRRHRALHSFPTRRSSDLQEEEEGMEIRLQRDALLSELALLQGIVERRTTIPILSHLLLDARADRSEEHTSELQSQTKLVCRLLLEKTQAKRPVAPARVRR